MAVMIAHASKDERGKINGGKAGDQTGKEVCIRSWYSRPWNVVIRFMIPEMRERFAYAMERAANNPHIGYDQYQRNTALTQARKVDYDPGKISVDCETDCSALVTLCCIYAGIPERSLYKDGNSATTTTLKARLRATGTVDIYTSKKYTASPDLLIRGDILLYEGHHVACVVQGNTVADKPTPSKSITDIAREVLHGTWGNGAERVEKLTAAGYNYAEVQAEVNRLLKK